MSDTNNEAKTAMEELRDKIKNKDKENALKDLNQLIPQDLNYDFGDGETILHVATKYDDGDLVEAILERKKELVLKKKTGIYEGQTPLHIAIAKSNRKVVELMLDGAQKEFGDELPNLLNKCCATGSQFHGTVMMHQLPLFVAALKFDIYMIEQLLHYGADLLAKNDKGDTIFHVLIHHLNIKRDTETEFDVHKMFEFFHDQLISNMDEITNKNHKHFTHLWFTRNEDGLTPLKLAARYKLVSAFEFILELRDVYCIVNKGKGSFDIKKYDVTEIDSMSNITDEKERDQCINESVLEMMFERTFDRQDFLTFMQLSPIKVLIEKKWNYYAYIYSAWMVVQLMFMICLTAYAVDRSTWHRNNASYAGTDIAEYFDNNVTRSFVPSFLWISFIFAVAYLILVVILVKNAYQRPNARLYWTHNVEYIVFMFVMSITLIIDFIVTLSAGRHGSIALILALFFGWWFCIFFLRGWKTFSTFTVMIKDVLLVDFPSFSVIIAIQLFAFTTSMHTLFQGENVPNIDGSEYNNFGRTLLTMFNLMLGLGEIEDLHQARVNWLAITLFVLFIMVTYILLLNALLAMMSTTCDKVLEEKESVWRLQQLSVILFLESIFCNSFLRFLYLDRILKFEEKKTSSPKQNGYFLYMETKKMCTMEETETTKKNINKEIDRTLKHILTVGMETSEYPNDNDMKMLERSDDKSDSEQPNPEHNLEESQEWHERFDVDLFHT